MSLPKMPAVDPLIKPAAEETTYDSWFLKTFVQRATTTESRVRMVFARYDYDSSILSSDSASDMQVEIDNLYEDAARYPIVAQAMGVLLAAGALYAQKAELENKIQQVAQQIESAGEGADTSTLESDLADLNTALDAVFVALKSAV
jgi:hypothetical protein